MLSKTVVSEMGAPVLFSGQVFLQLDMLRLTIMLLLHVLAESGDDGCALVVCLLLFGHVHPAAGTHSRVDLQLLRRERDSSCLELGDGVEDIDGSEGKLHSLIVGNVVDWRSLCRNDVTLRIYCCRIG